MPAANTMGRGARLGSRPASPPPDGERQDETVSSAPSGVETPFASYAAFLERKAQLGTFSGFDPLWMPDFLFDFQRLLVDWAIRKGKAAIFADCGLGKTPMQLVWAENVVRHTGGRVLILTPIAVGYQTLNEGRKFDIACARSRDGSLPSDANIVITNYEKLHLFNPTDFEGVVCDESSILKHFSGATQARVTRFMLKLPYRLLCTATAAPNDYIELGTSSEALGELGYSDMLSRFFRQSDKKPHRREDIKQWQQQQREGRHYQRLAFRISQQIGQWRLKSHAITPFWRWVSSWARACRKPSDLGCPDAGFALPPLEEREHIIMPSRPADGNLFVLPAFGLKEEREERRRTLDERCAYVAQLVTPHEYSVIWCHLNEEGDTLERAIPHALQVAGRHDDDYKDAVIEWFVGTRCLCGDSRFRSAIVRWADARDADCGCGHRVGPRRLISKARIFGFGLNLQFCHHVVTFATHSYEQFYQSVRRCWRFGQRSPVIVDIVATEGERRVSENMKRKAEAADVMFTELLTHMHNAMSLARMTEDPYQVEVPRWVS